MTNVGKWTAWYQGLEEPWPYGETTSYEIGAAWLADCARTEDWGCGAGWLSTLIPPDRYRGVDGTPSPRCAEVVDLVEYRSTVPGIFMRHILEHNYEWARLLDNALASFTERMALILCLGVLLGVVRNKITSSNAASAGRITDNLTNVRMGGGGVPWQGPTSTRGFDLGVVGSSFESAVVRSCLARKSAHTPVSATTPPRPSGYTVKL